MCDIEFTYDLTNSEIMKGRTAGLLFASRLYRSMLILALLGVLISVFIHIGIFVHGGQADILFLCSLLIISLPIISVRYVEPIQPYKICMNKDYYKIIGDENWTELGWPGFSLIKEVNSYFFLRFQRYGTYVIFKNKLTAEQVSEIRKLLAATPVRKKKLFADC